MNQIKHKVFAYITNRQRLLFLEDLSDAPRKKTLPGHNDLEAL